MRVSNNVRYILADKSRLVHRLYTVFNIIYLIKTTIAKNEGWELCNLRYLPVVFTPNLRLYQTTVV